MVEPYFIRPGPLCGKRLVKTPTNTWKAWTQLSIDTIFVGLVMGSRAKEGEEPRINGELIFSFGKLVGQEQTKVNKFIIPDFGFEFQWHPCIDWQIDGQEYVLRLECP